jgi:tripartite-type tricarboxylate transporter receptor subunit TctC
MRVVRWAAGVVLLVTSLAASAPSPAVAQADFYRGKQINLVIGAFPGGGYDTYARVVARYLGKHIPGNPVVVPQNMGGAAGARAASYIDTTAPKDGTTMGAILPGNVLEPLLGDRRQVGFDPSRFVYLGSASADVFLCLLRADAPVKSFAEVLTKEAILGATGDGGSNKSFPALLNNVLGAKFRLVSGYPGSREVVLAIEKGEVQGICGMSWSSISVERRDWVDKGFVRIIVQEHATGHPIVNRMGVPLAVDFAKTQQDRQVLELVYTQEIFGRPYVLPAGVPPDRADTLRRAFVAALADKDLLAEAQKLNLDLEPVSGGELQGLVAKIYATPAPIIERARDALIYKPR